MVLGLAACQSVAPTAPTAQPSGWDAVVQAARQEGTVTVYGPPGAEYRTVLVEAFGKTYPGVKVEASFADINEKYTQVTAERTAGRFIPDVWVSGTSPTVTGMKEAGMLSPLGPALQLPEVLDTKAWLQGQLAWADAAEPRTTLMFQGGVNNVLFYNTSQLDPSQFSSYADLLDPRWRGKIVATDIRQPGPGGVPSRFMYKQSELGPTFFERLFGEQDVQLSSDQRQMIDWLARGQYTLGLLLSDTNVQQAIDQGLPVAAVPSDRFKEGASIGPGYGAVALMDKAPHPNAAKLYINWLLSKDGQTAWQTAIKTPSLRIDISKDGLPSDQMPKPGGNYTNAGVEDFARLTPTAIRDAINRGLAKAGKS
jgi:iron(III) transport system substrate-binding protein